MNFEKVVFAFVVLLALTLNFGFFYGDPADPAQHAVWELYAALFVSLIATILKVGDRSWQGSMLLAASLVGDVQLATAAVIWAMATPGVDGTIPVATIASVVSLSGGAVIANLVSVIVMLMETVTDRL